MTSVDVVRDIYAGMAAKDIEALVALVHPDCVITQDARLPWGGRHVGHEGFGNFALALMGTIDSAVTIEALFTADDEVIQFGRTRGTVLANGASFDIPEVHRWTIRDGQAIAAHFAIDTEAMLHAINGE
jgi:ketosteroid isomerase-like protein